MNELQYRQAVRDIDRAIAWRVVIPRRKRSSLERYLQHPSERVRAYIEHVFALDAQRRAEYRAERELFEASSCVDELGGRPSSDAALWVDPEQDCIDQLEDDASAWDVWIANGRDGPIQDDGEPEIP